jgi:hypothetical protein
VAIEEVIIDGGVDVAQGEAELNVNITHLHVTHGEDAVAVTLWREGVGDVRVKSSTSSDASQGVTCGGVSQARWASVRDDSIGATEEAGRS